LKELILNTSFEFPKALRSLVDSAEGGTLSPRELYPVEVKALCDLVAGAILTESPRVIAPRTTVTRKEEGRKGASMYSDQVRAAYFFICRFENGRVWQCSLFTDWIDEAGPYDHKSTRKQIAKRLTLAPPNVAKALTRSILPPVPVRSVEMAVQS
jgi:hypothetical protein